MSGDDCIQRRFGNHVRYRRGNSGQPMSSNTYFILEIKIVYECHHLQVSEVPEKLKMEDFEGPAPDTLYQVRVR